MADTAEDFAANRWVPIAAIVVLELLLFAMNHVCWAQEEFGGQIVFLGMDHGKSKSAAFYGKCGFAQFGERKTIETSREFMFKNWTWTRYGSRPNPKS